MAKTVLLGARVDASFHESFTKKCRAMNRKPSDVMREMYSAFIDGRLTIELTEEQKTAQKGMYKNVN